jgi:hypothetical protein
VGHGGHLVWGAAPESFDGALSEAIGCREMKSNHPMELTESRASARASVAHLERSE